jgi:hypothetical protein
MAFELWEKFKAKLRRKTDRKTDNTRILNMKKNSTKKTEPKKTETKIETKDKPFKAMLLDLQSNLLYNAIKLGAMKLEDTAIIYKIMASKGLSSNLAILDILATRKHEALTKISSIRTQYLIDKKNGNKPRFMIIPKTADDKAMLEQINILMNKLKH